MFSMVPIAKRCVAIIGLILELRDSDAGSRAGIKSPRADTSRDRRSRADIKSPRADT